MTKIKSIIKRSCFHCLKSTSMEVKEVKKGKESSLRMINRRKARWGSRGNLGRFSKVPAKRVKTSKKPHLLCICSVCKKKKPLTRARCVKFSVVR
jgi:large subunit ribosomal protein L44e